MELDSPLFFVVIAITIVFAGLVVTLVIDLVNATSDIEKTSEEIHSILSDIFILVVIGFILVTVFFLWKYLFSGIGEGSGRDNRLGVSKNREKTFSSSIKDLLNMRIKW